MFKLLKLLLLCSIIYLPSKVGCITVNIKEFTVFNESINLIKKHETLKNNTYCLFGKKYIGYGHLIYDNKLLEVSNEQADSILLSDFNKNYLLFSEVLSNKNRLLLTFLSFNIGVNKVKKSKIYKMVLNSNCEQEIYSEYIKYHYINNKPHSKLKIRRKEEFYTTRLLNNFKY